MKKLNRKARKQGFTMIEMIVTVTIIGAMAAAGIMSYQKIYNKSRVRDAATQLKALHKAVHIYRMQNGSFKTGTNLNADSIRTNFGIILNESQANMQYKYTSDGTTFTIRAEESSSCGGMCIQATEAAISSSNPCCVQNCPDNTLPAC